MKRMTEPYYSKSHDLDENEEIYLFDVPRNLVSNELPAFYSFCQ